MSSRSCVPPVSFAHLLPVVVALFVPIFYFLWNSSEQNAFGPQSFCIRSIIDGEEHCRPSCKFGHFSLYGMAQCHPWLTCDDLQDVNIVRKLGGGLVKKVYLARWRKFYVTYNQLTSSHYSEDFQQGIKILKQFHGRPKIIQLIGHCADVMITEFHSLGEATKFSLHLDAFPERNNIFQRFLFCIDYVEILSELHSSTENVTYVMCDTNSLSKVFTQYLLSEDMRLVLNDVDSVAEVTKVDGKWIGIICGKSELDGEFVAPEQRWIHYDEDYNDNEMQTYDEKTDIWKIPDVCNNFLGNSAEATSIQMRLLDIHMACKHLNPEARPTAQLILTTYRNVLNQIFQINVEN